MNILENAYCAAQRSVLCRSVTMMRDEWTLANAPQAIRQRQGI